MKVEPMKKIDTTKLQKGDIILSTSIDSFSEAVRSATNSDISHAMIYVSNGSVMDSTGEGVQARNIQKIFYPQGCALYVYRLKTGLSESDAKKIIHYVRTETGTPYDKIGAGRSMHNPKSHGGDNQFCSRLVARAYEEIGVKLTENPDFATPAQIKLSHSLEPVEDAVVDADELEIEALNRDVDTTVAMRVITNDLLEDVRGWMPKIRTLNDITKSLLAKPGLDRKVLSSYKRSGYLDFWEVEISRFPWRYNYDLMVNAKCQYDFQDLVEYCRSTVRENEQGDYDHWKANADEYKKLYRHKRLRTFEQLAILYHSLSENQNIRLINAKRFLVEHADVISQQQA
ncbi:YiiX/YebB-like N1pC/P60 family cysteine hydrolase [Pseudomonas spelaei]